MEFSERWIQKLEDEGFPYVYDEAEAPDTLASRQHTEKVSLIVTEGSLEIRTPNETRTLGVGDRYDVPRGTSYETTAGPQGCQYVVGQMVKGDF